MNARRLRRVAAFAMSLLLFQATLVGSGLLACGAPGASHAADVPMAGMHPESAPCGTTGSGHDGDCSQSTAPGDCGASIACASPVAVSSATTAASAPVSHDEPAGADDLAPPSRPTAPEPPPPRA